MTIGFESIGSFPIGFESLDPEALGLALNDRLLRFKAGERYRALVGIIIERALAFIETVREIREAFDLTTATGDRLDRIGSLVYLDRLGLDDSQYRTAIQIRIQLILSSTGTTATILEIVRLFTGLEATEYGEAYPKTFWVGADTTLADGLRLKDLVLQARAGGYNASVIIVNDDSLICDDPAETQTTTFIDDADSTIFGAALLAAEL